MALENIIVIMVFVILCTGGMSMICGVCMNKWLPYKETEEKIVPVESDIEKGNQGSP